MIDPLASHRITIAYKIVVTALALSSANYLAERLNLSPRPISEKDIVAALITQPDFDKKPMMPTVNLMTANFNFVFREGKLFLVMNTKTNIGEVEHYREWEKMPCLVGSNEAYHLSTQWLARAFVDVATLNRKYPVHVGQPSVAGDQGTNKMYPRSWRVGTNLVMLPLVYVTWGKGDYQAAKVGIFGPTKQLMGLTIQPTDLPPDPSICSHVYLVVTNQKELMAMTNVPAPMIRENRDLYNRYWKPKTNAPSRLIPTNSESFYRPDAAHISIQK